MERPTILLAVESESASYMEALERAGFRVECIREVTEEDPEDPWFRIPMFLDLRAAR